MPARQLMAPGVSAAAVLLAAQLAAAEPATGPYAGAAVTWTTLPTDVVETEFLAPPPPIIEDGTFDADGFGGTLLLGYRCALSSTLLAGVEVDGTWFGADGTYHGYGYDSDWLITLRGVLGVQATADLVLAASFGAAWLDVEASEDGAKIAGDTLSGWVVGASAEHALAKSGGMSVSVRGDYLYADFEGFNYETAAPVPPVVGELIENDSEMHQLRLGVVIRPE